MIEDQIFAPLVDLDARMQPRWSNSLATRIEIADRGTRYLLHLRPARWSDGTSLDARDVAFTLLLQANPSVISGYGSDFALMTSARALDARTVEIRLSHASPPFLLDALGETLPLPEHLLAKFAPGSKAEADFVNTDASFAQHPVVSGPYRIAVHVPDSYLILERNPAYWGAPAYLARVAYRVYPQQDSLYAAIDAGEADVTNIPPALWRVHDRLRGDHRVVTWPWNVRFQLLMNFADSRTAFFREKTVRRAMLTAIDRDFIVNGILAGQANVLDGPLPSFSPYFNRRLPHVAYSPAAAAALLDANGWHLRGGVREKNGVALRFTLKTGGATDAVASNISELIQANLKAVGIDCILQNEELQTFFQDVNNSKFQMALQGRILGPYPDDYIYFGSGQTHANGGNNYGSYDSPTVNRWIVAARTASNDAAARAALDRYQAAIADDPPALWLYSNRLAAVIPARLTGYDLSPRAAAALPQGVQFWRLKPAR
jgi:peptide/nickel transport system substrate-binding protein